MKRKNHGFSVTVLIAILSRHIADNIQKLV